jgi:ABC-type dipeptide/oligopeptide/nickel transport system permease subunit
LKKRRRDALTAIGVGFLLLLVIFAIFGPWVRHHYLDPSGRPLQSPSAEYWFGTDEQGRDVFARVAYGARISLTIGLIVQAISLFLGICVGVIGVYASKWVRIPLLRLTDGMFAFPDILLAFLIIGIWGPGMAPVIVALSVTAWPGIARLVVTQVQSVREREFVVASRALGASTFYIVTRHVLPQIWGVLLAVAMIELAGTILAESTLSFLGIGVMPPTPSWGKMVDEARNVMIAHPTLLLWPSLFLAMTIFALNFVGDGLRRALDPKER